MWPATARHFDDTADRLIRLRWEAAPFANLRFKEMAGGLPGVHLNPREPQRAWDEGCRNTSAAFQVWSGFQCCTVSVWLLTLGCHP